jgi:hypothetical protein
MFALSWFQVLSQIFSPYNESGGGKKRVRFMEMEVDGDQVYATSFIQQLLEKGNKLHILFHM